MSFLFKIKKQQLGVILLWLSLLVFLFSTDPNKLSIGWLILPFIWLFLCLFMTFLLVVNKITLKRELLTKSKRYTIAFIAASLPTLILLLKSIDQLSAKDLVLFIVFYLIISFYVSKLRFISHL